MIGVHWDDSSDSALHACYVHSVYKLGGYLGHRVLYQSSKV